jgi:hypothetical protein
MCRKVFTVAAGDGTTWRLRKVPSSGILLDAYSLVDDSVSDLGG